MKQKLKTIKIKGKDYVEVNERLKYFRNNYPGFSLTSEVIEKTPDSILILTTIRNDSGVAVSTGLAEEIKGSTFINKTSYVENCETSAIGRSISAAGMAGSGSEYCSADELANVLVQQKSKTDTIQKREMDLDEAHHMLADEVADKLGGKVVTEANMIKFGKHKGKSWSDVSDDYVQWCMTKSSADFVKEQAQAEYNRRNKKDSKPVDLDEEIPF